MSIRFFVFIWLICVSISFGKEIQILDSLNQLPVPFVDVIIDGAKTFQSDSYGIFELKGVDKTSTVTFSQLDYHLKSLTYQSIIDGHFKVYLVRKASEINEVIVSASRWEEEASEMAHQVTKLEKKEIEFLSPQTSADLIAHSGSLHMQKSQQGGGSPMMRGFAASSILLVVDQIRLNNAIYRSGNLHNMISQDANNLAKAEVIFGPGSVLYGSDALGGVIHFHTYQPPFTSSKKLNADLNLRARYASANQEQAFHVGIGLSNHKLSSQTSISFNDFSDLRSGNVYSSRFPDFGKRTEYVVRENGQDAIKTNENTAIQRHSGYQHLYLLQKLRYKLTKNSNITYGLHFSNSSNIPRYDRLIEYNGDQLKFASWYYGPQYWLMHHVQFQHNKTWALADQLKITAGLQNVKESRHDRTLFDVKARSQLEQVSIYSLQSDFLKHLGEKHSLYYGLEGNWNDVSSTAYFYNLELGQTNPTTPRYPDGGSKYASAAAYAKLKYSITPKWIYTIGTRWSKYWINLNYEDATLYNFPVNSQFLSPGALSGSTSIIYNSESHWKMALLLNTGYRAPNVDDLSKIFSYADGRVLMPNTELSPEYSYNVEISVNKHVGNLRTSITAYYTWLRDAMVRRATSFHGADSIFINDEWLQIDATVNVGRAYIYGFAAQLSYKPVKIIEGLLQVNYQQGKDQIENIPLRHVSPLQWRAIINLDYKKLRASCYGIYNGAITWEQLAPSEQAKPHLYSPDGSLAWFTLNLKTSYQLNEMIQFQASMENIFDQHYRPYSSGISAAGRNFIISITANI